MAAMLTETALFLSTPSARRATIIAGCCPLLWIAISIHALREEGDVVYERFRSLSIVYFYPRPPRGGRPSPSALHSTSQVFLSTPSARRATEYGNNTAELADISIHALREEGDAVLYRLLSRGVNISIHALREEGDARLEAGDTSIKAFLSTPSARRATNYHSEQQAYQDDFYPRPPRGGRRITFTGH